MCLFEVNKQCSRNMTLARKKETKGAYLTCINEKAGEKNKAGTLKLLHDITVLSSIQKMKCTEK
ncbi:CLUMA_CG000320, isoform A [Clunio marinus]|uniref:CLUMA_CG000320, isoform A n=1 Tax=Clunio marinus TaxID=568069 RepID=A0A1J1HFW0_9DIPT|nr:CLUMA_CG000320, isoform A [Clunio marinus]